MFAKYLYLPTGGIFFGWFPDGHLACDGKRQCVDAVDGTLGGRGVDEDRPYIGADICLTAVKADISAVGDVDLPEPHAAAGVEHLDLMRAVDHDVQFGAVYADVVAHVSQLLDDRRVALGIYVAGV